MVWQSKKAKLGKSERDQSEIGSTWVFFRFDLPCFRSHPLGNVSIGHFSPRILNYSVYKLRPAALWKMMPEGTFMCLKST